MSAVVVPGVAERVVVTAADVLAASATLDEVLLNGTVLTATITERILSADIAWTIEGASTVTLRVHDPVGRLLSTGILTRDCVVEVDGVAFALVKVAGEGSILTLVFEDEVVARLRRTTKPKRAARGKVTRGQFMVGMVREERPRIPVVAPEMNVQLPVGVTTDGKPGFAPKANLKVKGKRATATQLKLLADVLDVGRSLDAPTKVLEAAVATVIVESVARNLRDGDLDSAGAFQQRPSQGWGTLAQVRNVRYAARQFFTKAIAYHRTHRSVSVGALAQAIQRSKYPNEYTRRAPEAKAIVAAYSGSGGEGATTRKRIIYSRGLPGGPKRENTWDALLRLADEVGWRRWAFRGRVYIMAETFMFRSQPGATITPDDEALVERPSFDVDVGKTAAEVTLRFQAGRWGTPPGAVVVLDEFGDVLDGRWLLTKAERPLTGSGSKIVTVTLAKPRPELPEPVESESGTGGGATSADKFTGKFVWPTGSHTVSSGFGPRGGRNHDGIDIPVPIGTLVRAAAAGKVEHVGEMSGYGKTIIVRHNSTYRTLYAHLNAYNVSVGATVKAEQTIARSGNTGRSTGPHLHFEIQRSGRAVDPRPLLP